MSARMLALSIVIAQAALAGTIYHAVDLYGQATSRERVEERISLLHDTLRGTIDQYVSVPDLVGASRVVADLLLAPGISLQRDNANRFLQRTSNELKLAAIFVLNDRGLTQAASNWQEPTSFVGQNYAFRPYFSEAMMDGRGRYFGIGVTSGQPGYFLSSRVHLNTIATGVIVVKVDFSPLETSWASAGEHVIVSDADGIVFLSTSPHLRYRPLRPLSAAQTAALAAEQRYADRPLGPVINDTDLAPGARASRAIAGTPWRITVVTPWVGRGWPPAAAAALAVLSSLVLMLAMATWRQRRARLAAERAAYADLERRVQDRTSDLAGALTQLETEIGERQRIDAELHRTRDELVQAAKLTAMGRAFSGLAHELNQPLAALRTYISSTRLLIERGDSGSATGNLTIMEGAIQRLTGLTGDLRRLARRSDDAVVMLDLAEIVNRVAALLKFRLADAGVALEITSPGPVFVIGNANRLEQVVLNLVLNALDAVAGEDAPRITIFAAAGNRGAVLCVSDWGPGISEHERERLFEPFFTTKEDGVGLGLAISYAIIKEHGGLLEYERTAAGETRFHVLLPLAGSAKNTNGETEP